MNEFLCVSIFSLRMKLNVRSAASDQIEMVRAIIHRLEIAL